MFEDHDKDEVDQIIPVNNPYTKTEMNQIVKQVAMTVIVRRGLDRVLEDDDVVDTIHDVAQQICYVSRLTDLIVDLAYTYIEDFIKAYVLADNEVPTPVVDIILFHIE